MQALTRLVAMVLVLTLGGGAQACLASCANPAPAQTAKPAACHRCEKPKDKSPEAPCPRCQLASQDRTTAGDQTTLPAPTLAFALSAIEQPLPIHRSITTPRAATHGPPAADLFHQFCLLLI
jgi:uncharacterized paraquat-inducible protein A